MTNFVHIHNHSDYSLLDGAASIGNMVKKAKSLGMDHLALTDHGNMFGSLRFYDACIKEGINPLVGCEVYISPESRFLRNKDSKYFHMVLIARNFVGYKNLMRLVSDAYKEGFYFRPRIDDEILTKYSEGLICTSACIGGEIPQLIIKGKYEEAKKKAIFYNELFGQDNFYMEVQRHGIPDEKVSNDGIVKIGKETGIPIIATNDIHYIEKDHAKAHEILLCIGTAKKLDDPNHFHFYSQEFYFKTPEEMSELFSDIPESITNTIKLAERCELEIIRPGPILPNYEIPEGFESSEDYVTHIVYEGLEKRYPEITDKIKERTDYELSVIFDMNGSSFAGYFLIVWDFIKYAKDRDIPVGPGRGSGAGSIVAYAMEITDIDPLKYNLLFERFLNPERVSMPDFDVDFCNEGRGEVIDYVTKKYGQDKVGAICTFGTLKTKAVIKDVARVLDIPFDEANEISKLIPEGKVELPDGSKVKVNVNVSVQVEPKLQEYRSRGGRYEELFKVAAILENMNRHVSTHACGMVIGQEILTEYVPLFKDQKTGQISTEFTMDLLEPCGLVKMDFLGLKTLTVIKNTEKLIRKHTPDFDIQKVSDEDEKTFKMLSEGKSDAVFQFESGGMQKILRDAKPQDLEEMIALNALYRPGPMQFIPQYIKTKSGKQKIQYPDPSLEEILKPTYGVIVYQEQVMQVAQIIGGFSLGKADIMRRAMGKKKVKEMEEMKVEFVAGAKEKGFAEKHASGIFEMLEPFAGYGFNKSHAAAYSVIAYKTAYLKANFPAEFMAANLTNEINNPDKFSNYLSICQQMGIEILPPDINVSEKLFTVVDGKIYYGLQGIKKVGETVVENIVEVRENGGPFIDIKDFLERVELKTVNKGVLEAMILSGLFDQTGENRPTLMHNLEMLVSFYSKKKESAKYGQTSLFEDNEEEIFPDPVFIQQEDFPKLEKLTLEKEYLGFFYSGHPMDDYREIWEKGVSLNLKNVVNATPGKSYTLLGMVKELREWTVGRGRNKGRQMAVANLEDFNGTVKLTFFPDGWEKCQYHIANEKIVVIKGKLDFGRGDEPDPQIIVNEVQQPDELGEQIPREVHIRLQPEVEETELYDLRNFMIGNSGECSVFLHIAKPDSQDETIIRANPNAKMTSNRNTLLNLKDLPIIQDAWSE